MTLHIAYFADEVAYSNGNFNNFCFIFAQKSGVTWKYIQLIMTPTRRVVSYLNSKKLLFFKQLDVLQNGCDRHSGVSHDQYSMGHPMSQWAIQWAIHDRIKIVLLST